MLGPQWVRNDLRADLPRLALLRSYPLRGRTVVGVEAAGSAVVMTVYQLCLVTVAYIAFWGADAVDPSAELRNAILLGAFGFLPGINFLSMLIQNGAALMFPAWMHLGAGRPIGIEALGHNMLVMIGFTAVLAVLLVVPVGAGGLVFLGTRADAGMVGDGAGRDRRARRCGPRGEGVGVEAGTGVREDGSGGGAGRGGDLAADERR